jgi:hypothetical protein
MAADFFVVPTAICRLLFVLLILAHDRRRIVHTAVTAHPTAAWTAQQFLEAFPWDTAPRYLIRDRDHAFDGLPATAKRWVFTRCLQRRIRRGKTPTRSDSSDPLGASASIMSSCSVQGDCNDS